MGVDPEIINNSPPASSAIRGREVRFDFWDDDVESPVHIGHLDLDTLNVEVDYNDGHGYRAVITAGEVMLGNDYCQMFRMSGSPTGGATGGELTGRSYQQVRVKHRFTQSVPDGTRVTYHVQVDDAAGNSLDETFYFDTWEWTQHSSPTLEFYDTDGNLASALQFYLHELGTEQEQTWNLWWGKGCDTGPDLGSIEIEVTGGTKNATGKEYIDEGWITFDGNVLDGSKVVLSGVSVNDYHAITIALDTDAGAVTSGLCALKMTLTPFVAGTGAGITGREVTGGKVTCRGLFGRPQNVALIIYGMTPERKAAWAECGFT